MSSGEAREIWPLRYVYRTARAQGYGVAAAVRYALMARRACPYCLDRLVREPVRGHYCCSMQEEIALRSSLERAPRADNGGTR